MLSDREWAARLRRSSAAGRSNSLSRWYAGAAGVAVVVAVLLALAGVHGAAVLFFAAAVTLALLARVESRDGTPLSGTS